MQLTLVENLQEEVEYALVGLLDLIEQYDGVGVLTNLVDQQTALLIADVSRRCTVEQCHGVLFLVLRHVETQHGCLVVEEEIGQRLGQLCLTCTRRAEEEERAHGLTFLVQA